MELNFTEQDWLIMLMIIVAAFFILREVMLWYYKVNEKIRLTRTQNYLLNELLKAHGSEGVELGYNEKGDDVKK